MATQLKNLRVGRVDLVDVGASQGGSVAANVVLFKRADVAAPSEEKGVKTGAFLQAFLASVAKRLGISKTDLEELPNMVRSTFGKLYGNSPFGPSAYVTRVLDDHVIASVDGLYFSIPWSQGEDGAVVFATTERQEVLEDWVAKATGFVEALMQRQMGDMTEEIGDMIGAFYEAVQSALSDDEVVDKAASVKEALKQFGDAVAACVKEWSVVKVGRKISSARVKRLKEVKAHIDRLLEEADYEAPVAKSPDEIPEGGNDMDAKTLAGLPAQVQVEIARLEKAAADSAAAETAAKAATATAQAEAKVAKDALEKAAKKEDPEDVWKGVSPAFRKLHEDAVARADSAEKLAKSERDERLKGTYIAKAAGFKNLPVKADDDWSLFKAIDERLEPAQATRLHELLKAGDAAFTSAQLFSEVGRSGEPVSGSAEDKINKLALEMVTKDTSMTIEKARVRVMEIHPDLYADHVREQRERV